MNIPLCPYVRHAQYHTLRANYFIKERVIFAVPTHTRAVTKPDIQFRQKEDAAHNGSIL